MSTRYHQHFDIRWLLNWLSQHDLVAECKDVLLCYVPESTLDESTPYVMTFPRYLDMINQIAETLQDETLGLNIGRENQIEDFGFVGKAMMFSPTIEDSLLMLQKYIFTISPAFRIDLDFDYSDSLCKVSYEVPNREYLAERCKHDFDLSIGALMLFFRDCIDRDWRPVKAMFQYSEPTQLQSYKDFFGCEIAFNQPSNSLLLHKTDLLYTVCEQENGYLLSILIEHLDNLLGEVPHKNTLLANVRYQIFTTIGTEHCTAPVVANSLFISHRTLNRELEQANTSFRDIKTSIIIEVAKRALKESTTSITNIALKLGYAETSSLIRLFKRETGTSPHQYRMKYRQ